MAFAKCSQGRLGVAHHGGFSVKVQAVPANELYINFKSMQNTIADNNIRRGYSGIKHGIFELLDAIGMGIIRRLYFVLAAPVRRWGAS